MWDETNVEMLIRAKILQCQVLTPTRTEFPVIAA